MKQTKALERIERIKQLGGFGKKGTQIVPDKTKYTRKPKHNKVSYGMESSNP